MQELEKILEVIDKNTVSLFSGVNMISAKKVEKILRKYINDGWIPVEERLPEEKGVYLVTYHPCYWDNVDPEVYVGIDTFRGKTTWAKRKFQRVIAWRPLPEPYRPERREGE